MQEWKLAVRGTYPLTLIFIDIDDFKRYNDGYGHLKGDECLPRVANCFKQKLSRSTDLVARYGGEEFVVLLPPTDENGAQNVAEELRISIIDLNIPQQHSQVTSHVTVSLGGATIYPDKSTAPVELLDAADHALYRAKRLGKNRCTWYDQSPLSVIATS